MKIDKKKHMQLQTQLKEILDGNLSVHQKAEKIIKLKGYPEQGVAFCVHHEILLEYCWSFKERTIEILQTKESVQHYTRFINFTFIPDSVLPDDILYAMREVNKAYRHLNKVTNVIMQHRKRYYEADRWMREAFQALNATILRWKIRMDELEELNLLFLFNLLSPHNTWDGINIGFE